jgi:hypothetical protein
MEIDMAEPTAIRQPSEVPSKPKMQIAIEHLDHAHEHLNRAMSVLSSVIFDLQKGADFIANYRDSLIKTLENVGGDVQASIESQIKEFIPKNYRQPEDAQS